MRIVSNIFKIFFFIIFFFIFLEILTRLILFFPTNINVFKYGFKKTVVFEIVDLSKLQITIVDKKKIIKKSQKNNLTNENIWIFGGSTTHGYACEFGQSSSWPDELFKLNKKFSYKNFSFNGADTDQQINILYRNIDKASPNVILWANKFNTKNIFGKTEYRNKHILNYEFQNANKTKNLLLIKRIDKTLKSYSLFYATLDKVVLRFMLLIQKNHSYKINPSEEDIIFSLKNFKINTIEAIELSKKYGVDEFYIVSLFSENDLINKRKKISLYEKIIIEIEKIYYPYVKIIYSPIKFNINEKDEYLCDEVHKTLKGNILQAEIINEKLSKYSRYLSN